MEGVAPGWGWVVRLRGLGDGRVWVSGWVGRFLDTNTEDVERWMCGDVYLKLQGA
jgi:hypothetical protein